MAVIIPATVVAQEPPTAPEHSLLSNFDIEIGVRYIGLISGTIQAQETPGPALSRASYDLKDLNVDDGYTAFVTIARGLTKQDSLSASFLYSYLSGTKRLTRPSAFDDVVIPAGSAETSVQFATVDFLYHRQLLRSDNSRWRAELNGGVRQFASVAKIRSLHNGSDSEDVLAVLVPTFGLKTSYRLTDRWNLGLDVSGSAPGDLFGITAESADVAYYSVELLASYRVHRNARVHAGIRFSALDLDFEGTESDGDHGHNAVHTWSLEPSLGISIRF